MINYFFHETMTGYLYNVKKDNMCDAVLDFTDRQTLCDGDRVKVSFDGREEYYSFESNQFDDDLIENRKKTRNRLKCSNQTMSDLSDIN